MTSTQAPIDSGFGMRSEPADVPDDVDLSGKRVVIAGGYSGLGLETTRALAGAGASITAPARRPDHARQVFANEGLADVSRLDGMGGVYCEDADIAKVADPTDPNARFFGVFEYAIDHGEAERLWALSAELTGVDAFA